MSKRVKHAPKHRAPSTSSSLRTSLRRAAVTSSVAVAATGVAVTAGVVQSPIDAGDDVLAAGNIAGASTVGGGADKPAALDAGDLAERRTTLVSRSDNREASDPAKAKDLTTGTAPAASFEENLSEADPRTIARALLPEYGFSSDQFGCLDALYVSESDWDMHADNPTSSAYGIPQALTETHDMPAGYFDSAEVQIRWGLDYIRDAYGSPCNAWSFKQGHQWY